MGLEATHREWLTELSRLLGTSKQPLATANSQASQSAVPSIAKVMAQAVSATEPSIGVDAPSTVNAFAGPEPTFRSESYAPPKIVLTPAQTFHSNAVSQEGTEENTDPPFGPQETWELQSILIEPGESSILLGQDQKFEATGIYGGGHEQAETEALVWTSSDEDVASIDKFEKGHVISSNKAGEVKISACDPKTGRIGYAKLIVALLASQMPDSEMYKGEAYRAGYADGSYDDRKYFYAPASEDSEIAAAYNEGFDDGKKKLDKKWGNLGEKIDAIQVPGRPAEPTSNFPSRLPDEIGIVGSIISILEANGASIFSKGVVGSTIGSILLPIAAFRLGADISQRREDHRQAIYDFVEKFSALTTFDALERARAMIKADKSPLTEFNDTGKSLATSTYNSFHDTLKQLLENYIDDDKSEEAFVALHHERVILMSTQWATFMINPRFHQ